MVVSFGIGTLLMLAGAVFCFVPVMGPAVGRLIGLILFLTGLNGLVRCLWHRSFRADFVLSLVGLAAGAFWLFAPLKEALALSFAAVWLLVLGAFMLRAAVICKIEFRSRWWTVLPAGLMHITLGVLSIVSASKGVPSPGLMIGLLFLDAGAGVLLLNLAYWE